jgi:hypothetical protein
MRSLSPSTLSGIISLRWNSARRAARRRPNLAFRPDGLGRLEDRIVLDANPVFYQAGDVLIVKPDGSTVNPHDPSYTYPASLPAGLVVDTAHKTLSETLCYTGTTSVDVSIVLYGANNFPVDQQTLDSQVYLRSATATLTPQHNKVTLTVSFTGGDCFKYRDIQCDVIAGAPVIKQFGAIGYPPGDYYGSILDGEFLGPDSQFGTKNKDAQLLMDLCSPVYGNNGLSPGYWKTHPDAWAKTGFNTTDTVSSVFKGLDPSIANLTLLQALDGGGGSSLAAKELILLRQAVAGLLNAADYAGYQYSVNDLVTLVNNAIATGNKDTITNLATKLDGYNH